MTPRRKGFNLGSQVEFKDLSRSLNMTKDESWKEIVSSGSNPASPSNEVNFQSLQDKLKNRMILQNASRILNRQTSREKRQA